MTVLLFCSHLAVCFHEALYGGMQVSDGGRPLQLLQCSIEQEYDSDTTVVVVQVKYNAPRSVLVDSSVRPTLDSKVELYHA